MARATLLRGFEPHVAEIGGIRTRYWVGGEGAPLVLVHGLAGAAYNFTELAPFLARRRRVLLPDLPGHGGTAALPVVESLGDLAAHVARVAEHEGMAEPAVLGYSMGGVVAVRLAAERPDAVSALVLLASAGIVTTTQRARAWLAVTGALRPARQVAHARAAIARRPNLRALVFGAWGAEDPRALSPEAVLGFLEAQPEHTDVRRPGRALLRDDPRLYLDRVRCPSVVVWGARDRLTPLEDAFELARRLRAPLRVLPATGHLVVGECPEECAELVLEWLELSDRVG
ncbi:MAG TPA: alpha/beta fold hydrolase [Gaiellaceae bacterium]|nr:alpha/beta fold hydrolase [Gaiellaceae bacterium]